MSQSVAPINFYIEDIKINPLYTPSLCRRSLDKLNEADFTEQQPYCQFVKAGIKCNAPYFCHLSNTRHSTCPNERNSDGTFPITSLTVAGNCATCLSLSVVCKSENHPIVSRSLSEEGSRISLKRKLGEILLDRINKYSKKYPQRTVPFSDLNWTEITSELKFQRLYENQYPYPLITWDSVDTSSNDFNLLKSFLFKTSQCFDLTENYSESDKLYYICPIILIACQIFGRNIIRINTERQVKGKDLKVKGSKLNLNGKFDLVISIGKVRICIVGAKKHEIAQGKAQCFAGMMALTDLDKIGSKPVYGIVTDYNDWVFSKNTVESHCYYTKKLSLEDNNVPKDASLKVILTHLYSLFYDAKFHHFDQTNN